MVALGIDPSTQKIAVAGLHESGDVSHQTFRVPADLRGARRLRHIRILLEVELRQWSPVPVVVVEIPWANPKKGGSSFALLASAAVLMEAAQAAHHGAVVLDMPTQSWKSDSVGSGNASKEQVMAHALGLGYDGADQDVADALCMAQSGWVRWHHAVRATEARRAA